MSAAKKKKKGQKFNLNHSPHPTKMPKGKKTPPILPCLKMEGC